jgi:hypothetical protein
VTSCYISNYITIQITNEYNFGFTTNITNIFLPYASNAFTWTQFGSKYNGFITFISNNVITVPPCYYSQNRNTFVFFTNGLIWSNGFLPIDSQQTGWPVYNWVLSITNHIVYALFDGVPNPSSSTNSGASLLDYVSLGPFGNSFSLTNNVEGPNAILNMTGYVDYWNPTGATDLANSPKSTGMLNQVMNNGITLNNNASYIGALLGSNSTISSWTFGPPADPSNVVEQLETWVANDPMVHYTADDLTWPGHTDPWPHDATAQILLPLTNSVGAINPRYSPWGAQDSIGPDMLYKDPQVYAPTNWAFPTNKFPGVGWIGRVHRGTPWQTVYLKADSSAPANSDLQWTNSWVVSPWFPPFEASPETYPTNDWALVDLFTAVPNDNAARGLLSVNQTNDAAWAAVFAGVIVPTNASGGVQIMPNVNNGVFYDFTNLMDGPYGINAQRTNYPNGVFHKVGYILGAPALTTNSLFLNGNAAAYSDEIVERIPQQTLSLLKVGEPQFVIFSWGQALKPKGPPYLGGGLNNNIYTNYEITGETLTRTVCHLVYTNGVKMVIDNFNVESGN